MSISRIIVVFASFALAFFAFVMSAVNFARLQYHTEPPTVPDYFLYVFAPALVGAILFAAAAVFLYLLVKRPNGDEPPTAPSSAAVPYATPSPTMGAAADASPKIGPDRAEIWAMIDVLSESMINDEEASEALHTVRDRFHRCQFSQPQKVETIPATKQAKPLPRVEAA